MIKMYTNGIFWYIIRLHNTFGLLTMLNRMYNSRVTVRPLNNAQ